MNRHIRVAAVAALSSILVACSATKQIQDDYRVDPVIVDFEKRKRSAAECGSPGDPQGTAARAANSAPRDVLCAIDLDTYVFPSDRQTKRKGYERVALCQERASAFQYEGTKRKTVQTAAGLQRNALLQETNAQAVAAAAESNSKKEKRALETIDRELAKAIKYKRPEVAQITQRREAAQTRVNAAEARETLAKEKLESAKTKKINADTAHLNVETDLTAISEQLSLKRQDKTGDDPETCRILRNMLQDEVISRSQQMCKKHLADTNATSASINTQLGFSSIVFSTLGAVMGGLAAKSALSGLAGASGATQTLINKEIYRDYVVPAINRAINGDRDRKLQEIWADQSKDLSNYSLTKAIVDAGDFHERCSFAHGLLLLGDAPDKRTPPRVEELQAQIEANNLLIEKTEKSLRYNDEMDKDDKIRLVRKASSQQEIDIVAGTVERLRRENDAISVRINLMKRAQNPN